MGPLVTCAIAAIACLMLAAVAWRARRWKRAGDHPHCRRCDFDLTGLPADGRCPECGADLAPPRAIVIGAKRPARFVQAGAATLAVACAAVALLVGGRVDWVGLRVRHSPTSWLLRDVAGPRGTLPTAAAAELERRMYDDRSTNVPTRAAITRALRREGVTARPVVRAGDVLPIALKLDGRLAGGAATPAGAAYEVQAMCVGASIVGGPNLPTGRYGANRYDLRTRGVTTYQELTLPRDASIGPATVRVLYEFRLVHGDAADRLDLRRHAAEAQPEADYDERKLPCIARWDEAYDLPVTVLAADATDDVTFASAAKSGVTLSQVVSTPKEVEIRPNNGVNGIRSARCEWRFPSLPVGIAYDVVLRDPTSGAEVPAGSVTCAANSPTWTSSHSGFAPVPAIDAWTADRADVILRPSAKVARTMIVAAPVLADEVVFKDVPVKRPTVNP